jgi:hypothetical protein
LSTAPFYHDRNAARKAFDLQLLASASENPTRYFAIDFSKAIMIDPSGVQ